jgi:molybdopterin-guanine dinucleotide biosynthesis protein MobB
VGYLKHTHHAFQIDTPGKDSYEIAEAGAEQVMLASTAGWALIDRRPASVADLADADLANFSERFDADWLDLLLVEGFHRSRYPKIEVHRFTSGKVPMYPQDTDIIAVVTDTHLPGDEHPPELPIDDPAAIAEFIVECLADGRFAGEDPRDELVDYYRRMGGMGQNDARIGNASVRVGARFWIAPANAGGALRREDLVACVIDDDVLPDAISSEAAVHLQIYRQQADARAVLHAHRPHSVAVSFGGRDFQPADVQGAGRLGSVPVLTVDSGEQQEKAAAGIAEALANFPLCLVAGDGSYAWGIDLNAATRQTDLLELSAEIYILARQAAAL